MLTHNDIFDGDYVRPEYITQIKNLAERHNSSFQWTYNEIGSDVREGIKYQFPEGYVIWFIPSDGKPQNVFVSTIKLKQRLLHMVYISEMK